jgi:hypothetical protein
MAMLAIIYGTLLIPGSYFNLILVIFIIKRNFSHQASTVY